MESNGYPSLGTLAALHLQLAANNRRIEAVVDSHLEKYEQLFQASLKADWPNLSSAVQHFSTQQSKDVDSEVVYQAKHVSLELEGSRSENDPPRHLFNLLHACRSAMMRLRKNLSP